MCYCMPHGSCWKSVFYSAKAVSWSNAEYSYITLNAIFLYQTSYSEIRTTSLYFDWSYILSSRTADTPAGWGLWSVWGKLLPQRFKAFEIRISILHNYYCPASNVKIIVNIAHIQATMHVIMIQQFQMLCILLCCKIGWKDTWKFESEMLKKWSHSRTWLDPNDLGNKEQRLLRGCQLTMLGFLQGPILFVSGNLLSSVALILINKRVVSIDEFNFMSVLSGVHFYFSFVTCCILLSLGLIRYKPVSNYIHLFRIALVSRL